MAKIGKYFVIAFFCSLFLLSGTAKAENPIITEITDYWFEYEVPTQFEARTYYIDGYNSDPQLWLYNEQSVELVTNDDFYGLQSNISIEVQPGRYRLRAGTCCYQADVWRGSPGWNERYELSFNGQPANTTTTEEPTTTSTSTTSTTSTTTTTTSTTTTTTLPPTTTSTSTTTTSTLPPTTTTTVPPTTTSSTSTSTTSTSTTTVPQTTTTTSTTVEPTTTTSTTIPVILPTITAEEATAVATNPEALATITSEEATQVFEALVLDDLSEDQLVELVAAVQDAPTGVRAAFEEEIDIFGSGAVDTYVPIGSTVPVKTRRALIAIGMAMSVVPAFKPRN
jgi:hypothetical protein